MLDEKRLYKILKINQQITKSDIDNFVIESSLEYQIQKKETKDSAWRFDKSNSMTKYFYKTTEMND